MRKGAPSSNVRYRDGEFEMRCDDCSAAGHGTSYWPLTLEFWWPSMLSSDGKRTGRSMVRCRACWLVRDAKNVRERIRRDSALRDRVYAANRAYKRENNAAVNFKMRERRAGRLERAA